MDAVSELIFFFFFIYGEKDVRGRKKYGERGVSESE